MVIGQSEDVNQERTDSTMTKRKRTKKQTMIYKTLDRTLEIAKHEPLTNNRGWTQLLWKDKQFLLH